MSTTRVCRFYTEDPAFFVDSPEPSCDSYGRQVRRGEVCGSRRECLINLRRWQLLIY